MGQEQDAGPETLREEGRGPEGVTVSSPSSGYPGKTVTVWPFPKGDVKGHALCCAFSPLGLPEHSLAHSPDPTSGHVA